MFTGADLAGAVDSVVRLVVIGAVVLLVAVLLALWKLFDIACWLF